MIDNCNYKLGCRGINCGNDFCERKYRLDCLYNNSLLTAQQMAPKVLRVDSDKADLPAFKYLAQIEKSIDTFVENGNNLYIHSYTCGNGKTSWAIKLLKAYFQKIWSRSNFECQGLFISVPKYLLELKANISSHSDYAEFVNKHIIEADLVVWDDIAAKVGSEFELNNLLNLINTRIDLGKSNIFTSNLGRKELQTALGERLASRICNLSYEVIFNGADKRSLGLEGN